MHSVREWLILDPTTVGMAALCRPRLQSMSLYSDKRWLFWTFPIPHSRFYFPFDVTMIEVMTSLAHGLKSICIQLEYIQALANEEDQALVLLKALPPKFKQIVLVLKRAFTFTFYSKASNSLFSRTVNKYKVMNFLFSSEIQKKVHLSI